MPPLGFLEALCSLCAHIHILHTTLQLLTKKTPTSLLMLLLFRTTKREKAAEHSSVLPGNAQSPPRAVRPHMCSVKGHFPRELRFEGKELHCLLPDHGIAHSVCQDCSSPVGLAARDSLSVGHTQAALFTSTPEPLTALWGIFWEEPR